jgi:small subunit ribosomal protein S17
MVKAEAKMKKIENSGTAGAGCNDKDCHIHGNLKSRGRIFKGTVIKKFHKRVVIEFERMIYVRKYERYKKSKTKIHARLPVCMEEGINVGDYIKVQECRPLSKIINFVVIEKIRDAEENASAVGTKRRKDKKK